MEKAALSTEFPCSCSRGIGYHVPCQPAGGLPPSPFSGRCLLRAKEHSTPRGDYHSLQEEGPDDHGWELGVSLKCRITDKGPQRSGIWSSSPKDSSLKMAPSQAGHGGTHL
ncbi:hypothetical protein ACRRTK_008624 [Alexandromys fortis]